MTLDDFKKRSSILAANYGEWWWASMGPEFWNRFKDLDGTIWSEAIEHVVDRDDIDKRPTIARFNAVVAYLQGKGEKFGLGYVSPEQKLAGAEAKAAEQAAFDAARERFNELDPGERASRIDEARAWFSGQPMFLQPPDSGLEAEAQARAVVVFMRESSEVQ